MANTFSILLGILAAVALLLGLMPLLGWTNWFLTLPLGIAGVILGAISRVRGGLILNVVVLAVAALRLTLLRLTLGGGVI